jgi:hypothetical protein
VKVRRIVESLAFSEDELFEMANLSSSRTGLKQRIWVSSDIRQRHKRPRLKVEGSDKVFYPVSIDDPIEFLAGQAPGFSAMSFKALRRFILLNRPVLMQYWRDELETEGMIDQICSV